jgi:feruloyl-CoA synthase
MRIAMAPAFGHWPGDTRVLPADVIVQREADGTIANRLAAFNEIGVGSSTTVFRAALLDTPPSFEAAEITDKGSINQRAVLAHRSDLIDALYAAPGDDLLM